MSNTSPVIRRQSIPAVAAFALWVLIIWAASYFPNERLWGINLLAFTSNEVRIAFIVTAIVAVAAIWLGHRQRVPLTWVSGVGKGIALAIVVALLATVLHAREAFLGDGTLRARDAMQGAGVLPSEFIPTALAALIARHLPSDWGIDGYDALRIVSILCAVIFVIGLWRLTPLASDKSSRSIIFWMLTFGSTRLLTGYVETYTTAFVFFTLWALASWAYLKGKISWGWVIALWALAMLSHVTATLLVPATIWLLGRTPDGSWRWNTRPLAYFSIVLLTVGGGVLGCFYYFQVKLFGVDSGHFFISMLPEPPHNYALLSMAHILDFFNQWLLIAPAFIVVGLTWFLANRRDKNTPPSSTSSWFKRPGFFWFLAASLPVAAGFFIDPKLGWARDWDLYTLLSGPALVGTALWLDRLTGKWRHAAMAIAILSCALWLVFSVDSRAERTRFESLLELDPSRADYGHEIMAQYYRRHDDDTSAIQHYKQALVVAPTNARYRLNIAASYYQLNDYAEAERWYWSAIDQDSTLAAAYHGLSLVMSDIRRPVEAAQLAAKANELEPNNPDHPLRLGSVLMDMGRLEEALPHLQRAARFLPLDASRLNSLAICYLALDRAPEAEAVVQEALKIDPSVPIIWLNAARVAMRRQKFADARTYLDGYMSKIGAADPHPEARMIADSLSRLTS